MISSVVFVVGWLVIVPHANDRPLSVVGPFSREDQCRVVRDAVNNIKLSYLPYAVCVEVKK